MGMVVSGGRGGEKQEPSRDRARPPVSDTQGLQGRCPLPAQLPWSSGTYGLGKGQGYSRRARRKALPSGSPGLGDWDESYKRRIQNMVSPPPQEHVTEE